jgi:anti-anti-sigma regulatory factor
VERLERFTRMSYHLVMTFLRPPSKRDGASSVELFVLDHLRADTRLVRVSGVFDLQAAAELFTLVELLCAALEMDLLLLDLSELAEFDTPAVGTLVRLATDLAGADVGLRVVASADVVGVALEEAGVRAGYHLYGSVDEALDEAFDGI